MAQLHEILAVESSIANQAQEVERQAVKNLSKETIFKGLVKTHTMYKDEDAHLQKPDEVVPVTTTVQAQLDYLAESVSNYFDVVATKEVTNQQAKADVVIDGKILFENVPATLLLNMEKRVNSLIGVYNNIPSLPTGTEWVEDVGADRSGIYKAINPVKTFQTTKKTRYVEMAKATERHPAQVDKVVEDETVGEYLTLNKSGALPAYEKAEMIKRLQVLSRAFKQARQRANSTTVENVSGFGKKLFDFVHSGTV